MEGSHLRRLSCLSGDEEEALKLGRWPRVWESKDLNWISRPCLPVDYCRVGVGKGSWRSGSLVLVIWSLMLSCLLWVLETGVSSELCGVFWSQICKAVNFYLFLLYPVASSFQDYIMFSLVGICLYSPWLLGTIWAPGHSHLLPHTPMRRSS